MLNYTEEQQHIINADLNGAKYYRILAVAGSGKTETITSLVAHAINSRQFMPHRVLMVTFTKAAAVTMRERLASRVQLGEAESVTICTLHSLCLRICRDQVNGSIYHERTVDNWPDWRTERTVRDQLTLTYKMSRPEAETLIPKIVELYTRSKRQPRGSFKDIPPEIANVVNVERIFENIESRKQEQHGLTFDDMPQYALDSLATIPNIRRHWGHRFDLVVIDEFQDTDYVQYGVVRHLTTGGARLVIVGDDDQSLYKWRGARPHLMVFRVPDDYSGLVDLPLTTNFRSGSVILKAANRCIHHNQVRLPKELRPRADAPVGAVFATVEANTNRTSEYSFSEVVPPLREAGCPLHEIAFICRYNVGAAVAETYCLNHDIPYVIYGNQSFHQTREARIIYAYLRLITDVGSPPDLNAAFEIAAMFPPRYFSKQELHAAVKPAYALNMTNIEYLLQDDVFRKIVIGKSKGSPQNRAFWRFVEDVAETRKEHADDPYTSMGALVRVIRRRFKIDKQFNKMIRGDGDEAQSVPALDHFQEMAYDHETLESLDALVLKTLRLKLEDDGNKDKRGRIQILTGHKAKGLEFDVVVVHADQGVFPHNQRSEEEKAVEKMEDERRIFYVMLTRARHLVFLHGDSQFFEEAAGDLPAPPLDFNMADIWKDVPEEVRNPPLIDGERLPSTMPNSLPYDRLPPVQLPDGEKIGQRIREPDPQKVQEVIDRDDLMGLFRSNQE